MKNIFIQENLILWMTFNRGLTLTGFQTSWLRLRFQSWGDFPLTEDREDSRGPVTFLSVFFSFCNFRSKHILAPYKDQCEKQMSAEKKKENKGI